MEGTSSEGPRRGHEPGGSPPWRPHARWPERGEPVGQEGRREDAQHEETIAAPDRSRSQARQGYPARVLRSYGEIRKEGRVRPREPDEARAVDELAQREARREDVVAREHRDPRFRGAHVRRA